MKKARSSIVIIGALALVTFALVVGVLSAAQKKVPVVVAARALEAGTKLSLADVEVTQVHAGAMLEGAFDSVEDVTGLVITVQRPPGDQMAATMVGDGAQNALVQALDPDHRPVAIHVDQASGLAGLLHVETLSERSELGGTGCQRAVGTSARILVNSLQMLSMPCEFRCRELGLTVAVGTCPIGLGSATRHHRPYIPTSRVRPSPSPRHHGTSGMCSRCRSGGRWCRRGSRRMQRSIGIFCCGQDSG